ncbi:MAG: ABC transporter ATP-binding protein [Bacillota bacterium]|nr:ABC transporter ATP-binding protein [Bacillota bacterium]
MDNDEILKIKNFTKEYIRGIKSVNNLTIDIKSGDIFGLVGPYGAGKTTTLKSIAGKIPFDEGNIYIEGLSVILSPLECKKLVFYMPASPDLYDTMTGIKYLNFIADRYSASDDDHHDEIYNLADDFEISRILYDEIGTYSRNNKQKLTIVAAFLCKPKLMIFDEPFAGIDNSTAQKLKEHIKKAAEEDCAVVFSTHNLDITENICNKIAVIQSGKLIECGITKDIIKLQSVKDIFQDLSEPQS